jgi:hypothetical protein
MDCFLSSRDWTSGFTMRWAYTLFVIGNQEAMQILCEISWNVATGRTEKKEDDDKEMDGEWVNEFNCLRIMSFGLAMSGSKREKMRYREQCYKTK